MEYLGIMGTIMIMMIGFWLSADILFEEKSEKDIKGIIMLLAGSSLIAMFNIDKVAGNLGFAKIIVVFLILVIFYKAKYGIKMSDSLIGSVIIYTNVLISELLLEVILSLLGKVLDTDIIYMARYNFIIDTITVLVSLIILNILKKKYLGLYKKIQDYDVLVIGIILLIFVIFIVISGLIPLKGLEFGLEMLVVALLMIGFFAISVYIIFEKIERQKEMENYKRLAEYSKVNEGLLEDYRVSNHENKNHLIIIDNMIPKNNRKAHQYIKSILDNQRINKYYFINELKHIPMTELKGFINFKLMEMINEKMNLQISISKEIRKGKLSRLTQKEKESLYNIIGVLIDNAHEASKESKEKEVVLQMYKENSKIVILIANTYKGKVDINRISEYGYSSKGKNHGTGLYIVEGIIQKSSKFTKETSLMENYFIQTIKIN